MPATTTLPDWAVTFHPFTWMHGVSLVWTVGAIVVSCWLGRRWLARGRLDLEERLALAWAGFVIGVNVWSLVFWTLPEQLDIKKSLPLELCDLACLLTPLIFLTKWRWARTLLFFWGIGLSTQAFVTPTLLEGPSHIKYHLFWLVHLAIVGSAIYDLAVRRYRPKVRDLLLAIAVTLVYGVGITFFNIAIGANYGFVGNTTPDNPTIVDKLGPWPQRVFIMAGVVVAGFCILWLVTTLIDRALSKRGDDRLLHCTKCGFDLSKTRATKCPQCSTAVPGRVS